MKVLGVGRSKGTYEGNPYDNFLMQCTEAAPKEWVGVKCTVLKVKADYFIRDLFPVINSDLNKLVGVEITASYDRWGHVQSVMIAGK